VRGFYINAQEIDTAFLEISAPGAEFQHANGDSLGIHRNLAPNKAGCNCVAFSKHGQQTGQGWITVGELLADVVVKLGSLRLGGYTVETEYGLDQLRCEWVVDLVFEESDLTLIQCCPSHSRWNRPLDLWDFILVSVRFLGDPFPQSLRPFFGIPVVDSEPAIEGSNEDVEERRRQLRVDAFQ